MLMTECSPSRKRIEKILAKNQPKSSAVNEQTNFPLLLLFDLLKYLQGRNSQNFLGKFIRFFVTFRCFSKAIVHRK